MTTPTPLLRAEGLQLSFGPHVVLKDVTLAVDRSTLYGLIGPSGVGKSVLLKSLAGLIEPSGGVIERGCRADGISFMFQEGALFDSLTVFDNVAFPLLRGSVPVSLHSRKRRQEVEEEVGEILFRVGLRDAAQKYPSQLSGGMQRRASLARALVGTPEVVFLDDPTAGLDPISGNVIMELVQELQVKMQVGMVVVSHDLRRLLPKVSYLYALFDGRMVESCERAEIAEIKNQEVRNFIECRYDLAA